MKDVILMPTYNERKNVKLIIPEIFALLPEINICVIDDNSPDKTAEAVKELMQRYSNLSLLERKEKTGLGDAYKDGFRQVLKDKGVRSVITMDADGSHQPKYLKDFLRYINDYDLIVGSRYVRGGGVENWEFWRRLLSGFGNIYTRILTGLRIKDVTAGFNCIRRELLEKIDWQKISSAGYAYAIEFKFYCLRNLGANFKEVPILFKSRREGESKLSHQIIREGIKAPLKILIRRLWKIK